MYADDTVIYTAGHSNTEIERVLSNEMESILNWLDNNRLEINLKLRPSYLGQLNVANW